MPIASVPIQGVIPFAKLQIDSDLLQVFSILMRDGWLKEADLDGIQPEKIVEIKEGAEALLRIFRD